MPGENHDRDDMHENDNKEHIMVENHPRNEKYNITKLPERDSKFEEKDQLINDLYLQIEELKSELHRKDLILQFKVELESRIKKLEDSKEAYRKELDNLQLEVNELKQERVKKLENIAETHREELERDKDKINKLENGEEVHRKELENLQHQVEKLKRDMGNQPIMETQTYPEKHLPGYENFGTIEIYYSIPSSKKGFFQGKSLVAYVPDSPEGRKVAQLLKKAFDLVETSSGTTNVVLWNDIHHKTSTHGGPAKLVISIAIVSY